MQEIVAIMALPIAIAFQSQGMRNCWRARRNRHNPFRYKMSPLLCFCFLQIHNLRNFHAQSQPRLPTTRDDDDATPSMAATVHSEKRLSYLRFFRHYLRVYGHRIRMCAVLATPLHEVI